MDEPTIPSPEQAEPNPPTPEQEELKRQYEELLLQAQDFLRRHFQGADIMVSSHEDTGDFDYAKAIEAIDSTLTVLDEIKEKPDKSPSISMVYLGGELSYYNPQWRNLMVPLGVTEEQVRQALGIQSVEPVEETEEVEPEALIEPQKLQVEPTPTPESVLVAPIPESESESELEPTLPPESALDGIRKDFVLATNPKNKKEGGLLRDEAEEAEAKYYESLEAEKQKIIQKVYAEHNIADPSAITPEDAAVIMVEIKRRIFDELVVKEHEAVMAEREASRKREGKYEKYKVYLEQGLKWYASQPKWKRLLVTTALGTTVGYLAGAAATSGVASYALWRGMRTAASMAFSGMAGAAAQKKWSLEEAEKKGEEQKAKLKEKFVEDDLKSSAEAYAKIEKETAAEKKKRILKKTAVAMGAGAAAGFLYGALEHLGTGGGGSSVVEQKVSKPSITDRVVDKTSSVRAVPRATEMGPGGGHRAIAEQAAKSTELKTAPAPIVLDQNVKVSPQPEVPPKVAPSVPEQQVKAPPPPESNIPKEVVKAQPPIEAEIPPQIVEVEKGGSVWKLTENALSKNPKFVSLDQAQKTYVISSLTNEAIKDPSAHGLGSGSNLSVGDKVDVSKLMGNKTNLDKIIDRATKLSETQKTSILDNNKAISNWVKTHPNEPLTESKVTEILSAKNAPARITPEVSDTTHTTDFQEIGPNEGINQEPYNPNYTESPEGQEETQTPEPPQPINKSPIRPELEQQIAEAKRTSIENGPNPLPEGRSMMGDFLDHQKVEAAFREDLDSVYGKSKLFGLTKIEGAKTAEWGSVRGMPAKKFTEFFTHNSEESELPAKLKEVLNSAPQHRKMALHLNELMKLAEGKVRPFDNENLEAFTRRLGGFVMASHEQLAANAQLPKAA